ncbi:drug/metabolite transporter (DMT)-like permease [Stella humosa]|uniref:Drug/metabolite transporter (DMT)-like permease n=1 Tax=Stella humosa TaxID=94 RepID=A0A3N1ME65_9PROT|nr:DMT family transporter [Stella humosa]ROQ01415.1 drug/metabolite transporter (DMT)-like permease [Stella humosa]
MTAPGRLSPAVVLAAAFTGIQVGAAMVATRAVVGELGPASLALLRYAIGFLCLVPVLVATGSSMRVAWRDLLPIAGLGILQFGVLIALINIGLAHIPAGRASLVFATFPLLTMLVAALLGRERLTAGKSAGVLVTILGVGLALADRLDGAAGIGWFGEGMVLAAALCGAVCTVLYRPHVARYGALPVGAVAMLASVAFLALPALGEGILGAVPQIGWGGWAAILFIGVGSGSGYVAWLWALRHGTPTRVTVFLGLGPVTATLLGAVLLDEPAGWPALLGLAAVLLGLWLALREPPAQPRSRKSTTSAI